MPTNSHRLVELLYPVYKPLPRVVVINVKITYFKQWKKAVFQSKHLTLVLCIILQNADFQGLIIIW
jgi:hypothetical protein